MVFRFAASCIAILLYGWINFLLNPVATVLSGPAAARQFANSAVANSGSIYGVQFFDPPGVPTLVLLIVMAAIWWKQVRFAGSGEP